MAFLREYEFRDPVLVKYFYYDNHDRTPSLVIRFDTSTDNFTVIKHRYWLSPAIVLDEIKRIYDLLDNPHWKSFVNTCSTAHRYIDETLF